MPKYYVSSGKIKTIVLERDCERAARKVIQGVHDLEQLSMITVVSESGFDVSEECMVMLTRHALEPESETGLE